MFPRQSAPKIRVLRMAKSVSAEKGSMCLTIHATDREDSNGNEDSFCWPVDVAKVQSARTVPDSRVTSACSNDEQIRAY